MEKVSTKTIENSLKNSLLFKNVSEEEINRIVDANSAGLKSFRKGEYIMQAGSRIESVRVILSGTVIVSRLSADGAESVYHRLEKGQIIGWETIGKSGVDSRFNYVADSNTELFAINSSSFKDPYIIGEGTSNQILNNIISMTSHENLRQYRKLRILSMNSIRKKVMIYLYYEYEKNGSAEFDIPYNRESLAAFLSVNRSALSRELGIMESEGLLKTKGRHFILLNEEAFRAVN